MSENKISIVISPEVLSNDIFSETYQNNTFGVYSGLSYVLSGGTNGESLLTGLTIPILLTQNINDIGYYSTFDGFIDQTEIVTNFVVSGDSLSPYNITLYNTSSYNFQEYLQLSAYQVKWGDGSQTGQINLSNPIQTHTYPPISSAYTITLRQVNIWGITEVSKEIYVPFTGVTIDNQLGNVTFTQLGGNFSGIPLNYNYIFTGDSNNTINAQISSAFTTVPFIVSGYTNSYLTSLKRYGTEKYTVGYVVNFGNDSLGYITDITPDFTAYTINNINYYDLNNGQTFFVVNSSGITSNDIVASGLTKDEYLLDFVNDPEIQTDVLIERGKYSAFETLQRLGEVDNIGDMERYGYGYFKINTT